MEDNRTPAELSKALERLQWRDDQGHTRHNRDGGKPDPSPPPPVVKSALEAFSSLEEDKPAGVDFLQRDAGDPATAKVKEIVSAINREIGPAVDKRIQGIVLKALKAVDGRLDSLTDEQKTYVEDRVKAALEETLPKFAGTRQPSDAWKGWSPIEHAERLMMLRSGSLDRAEHHQVKNFVGRGGREIELPRMNPAFLVRATSDAQDVDGAMIQGLDPWVSLTTGNPFREHCFLITLSAGVANLPTITPIRFIRENTIDAAARSTSGGVLGDGQIVLDNYTAETWVSNAALNDVPMLRDIIEFECLQQWGFTEGAAVFAALKAGVTAGGGRTYQKVNTGVANALPTSENVWGKVVDIIETIKTPYRMRSRFHISRSVEALLHRASAPEGWYAFNPALGLMTIAGYPVHVNDHCEDGNAAGEVSAVFGDFMRGVICASGNPLIIAEEYEQTRPGAMTYFSNGRTVGAARDPEALTGLFVAA